MVEIALRGGIIRELNASDIPLLAAISQDSEVQRYYFLNEPEKDMERHLKYLLELQAEEHASSKVRRSYSLPVEIGSSLGGFLEMVVCHQFDHKFKDDASMLILDIL